MKWYEIKNKDEETPTIYLYDEIGGWGIGAKDFIAELNDIKKKKIDMHINSPGGSVFDGTAIYNAIKNHAATVTSYIDGIAASIAGVIALAGKRVVMAKNSLYMMHNPTGLAMGTASDMRKLAELLDKVRDTMVGVYTGKSGKSDDEIREMLNDETWMTANEAQDAGFVDDVGDKIDLAACAKFIPVMEKMGFKNIPTNILGKKSFPSIRDIETALRDVGCSTKAAKIILAKGYSDHLRDEDDTTQPLPAIADHRDGDPPKPKKDRVAELVTRAEVVAPSN